MFPSRKMPFDRCLASACRYCSTNLENSPNSRLEFDKFSQVINYFWFSKTQLQNTQHIPKVFDASKHAWLVMLGPMSLLAGRGAGLEVLQGEPFGHQAAYPFPGEGDAREMGRIEHDLSYTLHAMNIYIFAIHLGC